MSELQKASEDVQALAAKFSGIVNLGAVLAKVGSIDQIVIEAGERAQVAKDAEEAAMVAHIDAENKVAAAKTYLQELEAGMEYLVDIAHTEYERIVGEAHAESAKLVDEAKAAGKAIEEHYAKIKAEALAAEAKVFASIEAHTHWHEKVEALKSQVRGLLG